VPPRHELTQIDEFSEKLFSLLRAHDSSGYVSLLPATADQMLNVKTGRASELPINAEALARTPDELAKEFNAAIEAIEREIGPISHSTLSFTKYTIDETPLLKKLGILKFDIVLNLEGEGKTAKVSQRACVLSIRGALIANGLSLIR